MFDVFDDWAEQIEALKRTERRQAVLTAPSDEPLSWNDRKTRLVRLDVAIIACHLFAMRVGVKSIPGIIRQRVQKTLESVGSAALAIGGFASLGLALLNKVLLPIRLIFELWRAEKAQEELEKAVRRRAIQTMRELYLFKLTQRSKVRRRRRVLTRHPIPRQRRPNGVRS